MEDRKVEYNTILKKYFGYEKLKDEQYNIIDNIINNKKDVCAILATGFGKSICFQLPYLITKKCVIVVSPLIALMEDQKIDMNNKEIAVCCLNSTNVKKTTEQNDILKGNYKIIYTSPEYIVSNGEDFIMDLYDADAICCFAIDEAHCVSTYGNDFRANYKKLNVLRSWAPDVPIIALTATATQKVLDDIINDLDLEDPLIIKSSFNRPNLSIEVRKKGNLVRNDIEPWLIKYKDDFSIVYAKTRDDTEKISKIIKNMGIECEAYHAGLTPKTRKEIQNNFVTGKFKVIVSTIAFGLGINQKIHLIIHYGCPSDLESYYQEIGRAGRDGKPSDCILYYSSKDFIISRYFLKDLKGPFKTYKNGQINEIEKYVYAHECRRKIILEHFGEDVTNLICNNCDNCKRNDDKMDLTNETFLLIKTIALTKCKFGLGIMINILRGSKSVKITQDMRKLSVYGKGMNHTEKWWKEFGKILINNGYLIEKQSDNPKYGSTLQYSPDSYKWLVENQKKDLNTLDKSKRILLHVTPDLQNQSNSKPINNYFEDDGSSKDTITITYNLFNDQSLQIKDIAKARGLTTETIEKHLVEAYKRGDKLDLNRLNFTDKLYNDMKLIISKIEDKSKLSIIKEKLNEEDINATYLQIKLALAMMQKT